MTVDNRWFGDIPEGWQVKRNKEIFAEVTMPSKTGQETLLTVSHITGVTPRSEKNVNMFMADDMTGYKQCQPGDLVINTMWAWMGALGTSKYDGICSPAYGVYRPRRGVDYHAGYFDYLFRTPNAIMEMTRYSKGIVSSRLRLYPKDFYQIETCLPPFAEQKAIADYLDKQLSLLDQKITLLNRKIEKHQELKKSLINEVICRGLNPSAEMINSSIEWVGRIPKHWFVKRFKEIAKLVLGKMLDNSTGENKFLRKYLKSKNIGWAFLNLQDVEEMYFTKSEMKNYRIKKNDILMSEGGEVGKTVLWKNEIDECYIQNSVHKVVINKSHSYKYFYYQLFMLGKIGYFDSIVSQVSIKHLTKEKLSGIMLMCPPMEEQEAIAAYLDEKTGAIDAIVAKLKEQVGMLQALRKTLISDVVTGKLKVVDNVHH